MNAETTYRRTIVVGDVHGCLKELLELLNLVGYARGLDRVVLAGDLVDRGPDSLGVVQHARKEGQGTILGNHDEKHIRWARYEEEKRKSGKSNPMQPFDAKRLAEHEMLTAEDLTFLRQMPAWFQFEDGGRPWLVTHAGVPTDKPLEKQDIRKLIRTRYVYATTGAYASGESPFVIVEGSVYWTKMWKGPASVVYGHIVQENDTPLVEETAPGVFCYGIDTGCCFGGKLTAAVFSGKGVPDLVSVKAHAEYAPRKLAKAE